MNLKNYVPFFISKIITLDAIYTAQDKEFSKLNFNIEDLKKQFFINTATWGLTLWEEFLGIDTDTNKSIGERRSRILAKIRGAGTTTKQLIKEISQSYADNVDVIENTSNYSFKINLENTNKGFPYNLDSLYSTIQEIKPAHLNVDYGLKSTTKNNFYLGSITRTAETITIYPWTPKKTSVNGKFFIPINNSNSIETTTIYPKGGN
ncbi:YmfQ family protein [Clostridium botulinum D/C]|uniref:YmfQ family protein n=1 Tax=Clostridium botulinum TaxID=1491 RepID=UPI001E5C9895|nr:YmfQ family protein [Clostridium botulinum D/C]MCD3240319.1 YmfQ family protein [Clostridium botulinum D/C]MCD3267680.1 YmfQ family protein [Clostridium botulinum D/C]MCD3306151.1 YmfQ family protein [Clostridium botulinum D/C]MCD3314861.1 YmfQ family protein [Clostridium botulinum D/C]